MPSPSASIAVIMKSAEQHNVAPSMSRSHRQEAWIGLGLVMASLLVTFLGAELAVRTFGSDDRRWEFGNFVTGPSVTEGRWRTMQPDKLLGYVPRPGYSGTDHGGRALLTFDEHGLRVHRRDAPPPAQETPPVLVVGNSYAMGEEVADDQTFPAHLQTILDRRVLNGGVLGYGIDQMVLRAAQLVPAFRPDLLVVSFIADDVRRTEMRVLWGVDVPYFDIVDGALQLRNVPVPPPVAAMEPLDPVRRVLGYSFLIDVVMRRVGMTSYWLKGQPGHFERAHDQGERVACLLMDRLWRLGQAHGARVLVVAQYTPHAWLRESTLLFEAQIIGKLLACARASGLETLDTHRGVEAAVRKGGIERYYINRHMNDAGNRLTADLIARKLTSQSAVKTD